MDSWSPMDVGQYFLDAASAAVHDRRQNLGSSMPSAQATHYEGVHHNLMEHSGLTMLEGLPLLGGVKEQVLGDEDDVLPGPENQDDTLSLTELQSVYHLPSKEAARSLNVSLSRLKRSCRAYNVLRWPHRKLLSLRNLQDTIHHDKNMKFVDKQRILEQIVCELAAVRLNPDHNIDPRLDGVRQAKYKLKYYHKTKHIHASASAAARKRRQSAGCADHSVGGREGSSGGRGGNLSTSLSLSQPLTGPLLPAGSVRPLSPFTAASAPLYISTYDPCISAGYTAAGPQHRGGNIYERHTLSCPAGSSVGDGTEATALSFDRSSVGGGGLNRSAANAFPVAMPLSYGGGGTVYSGGAVAADRSASLTSSGPVAAEGVPGAYLASETPVHSGSFMSPFSMLWCSQQQQQPLLQQSYDSRPHYAQQQQPQQQNQQQQYNGQHSMQWEPSHPPRVEARRPSFGITDETCDAAQAHSLLLTPGWRCQQRAVSLDAGVAGEAGGGGLRYSGSLSSFMPPPLPVLTASVSHPNAAGLHLRCGNPSPFACSQNRNMSSMSTGGMVFSLSVGGGAAAAAAPGTNPSFSVSGDGGGGGAESFLQSGAADVKRLSGYDVLSTSSGIVKGPAAVAGTTAAGAAFNGAGDHMRRPSVPYSHGVVDTGCPLPRCSSTGDPQAATAAALRSVALPARRQGSAQASTHMCSSSGGGGVLSIDGSCSRGGSRVDGSFPSSLSLAAGARDRFFSAEGSQQPRQLLGLPPRQSHSGVISYNAAAGTGSIASDAGEVAALCSEAHLGVSFRGAVPGLWLGLDTGMGSAPCPAAASGSALAAVSMAMPVSMKATAAAAASCLPPRVFCDPAPNSTEPRIEQPQWLMQRHLLLWEGQQERQMQERYQHMLLQLQMQQQRQEAHAQPCPLQRQTHIMITQQHQVSAGLHGAFNQPQSHVQAPSSSSLDSLSYIPSNARDGEHELQQPWLQPQPQPQQLHHQQRGQQLQQQQSSIVGSQMAGSLRAVSDISTADPGGVSHPPSLSPMLMEWKGDNIRAPQCIGRGQLWNELQCSPVSGAAAPIIAAIDTSPGWPASAATATAASAVATVAAASTIYPAAATSTKVSYASEERASCGGNREGGRMGFAVAAPSGPAHMELVFPSSTLILPGRAVITGATLRLPPSSSAPHIPGQSSVSGVGHAVPHAGMDRNARSGGCTVAGGGIWSGRRPSHPADVAVLPRPPTPQPQYCGFTKADSWKSLCAIPPLSADTSSPSEPKAAVGAAANAGEVVAAAEIAEAISAIEAPPPLAGANITSLNSEGVPGDAAMLASLDWLLD